MIFKREDIGFDGRYFTFGNGVYQKLRTTFSDKDVDYEIKAAERWLTYNPPKRDYRKFLCNWLNRANQKKNAPRDETPRDTSPRTAQTPKKLNDSLTQFINNKQGATQ